MIHQPFNDYYGTYRAMEEAYKEGWLRAIGVSNFYPDRLVDLCSFVEIKPAVNQVETHIFQQQKTAREYMEKCGVQHESWGPFAGGRKDFFTNPVLCEIGENDMNAIRALDEKENGVTHLKRVHHLPITLTALFARGVT